MIALVFAILVALVLTVLWVNMAGLRERRGPVRDEADEVRRPPLVDPDMAFEMADELAAEPEAVVNRTMGGDWGTQVQPPAQGEDRLTALVRNPTSLYLYWTLEGAASQKLRAELAGSWQQTVPVLRVSDVTEGASAPHESLVELDSSADHFFLTEGLEPAHRYIISYERRGPDGRFHRLSQSETVQMPPAGPTETGMLYEQYGSGTGPAPSSPWQ